MRCRLINQERIALHDIARHVRAAFTRSIGHHLPPMLCGIGCRLAHRIIERSGNALDLSAIGFDGANAAFAHAVGQVDHASAAKRPGPPGNGASMIAVRCRGDGHAGCAVGIAGGCDVGCRGLHARTFEDMALQHAQHCVSATQCLEAAGAEAAAFVLVENLSNARGGRKLREPAQRCWMIPRP